MRQGGEDGPEGLDDPTAREVREAREAQGERSDERTGTPAVRNEQSGRAENVVQVGAVYGDVHVGAGGFGGRSEGGDGGGPGGRKRRPANVPPAPGVFVDRTSELDGMTRMFEGSAGSGVLVYEGPPGVGKSSLLRQAAHRLEHMFPGGRVYYEYPPAGTGARSDPDQAVTECLRDLGVRDRFLPDTFEARVAEFRALTAEAPVLVVVEGAQEPAQVRPLIPAGPGGALLASSDGPSLAELEFGPEGAVHMVLDPLGAEAARELLCRVCPGLDPADPDVDRLAEACDGLPLALVMVGARLRRSGDTAGLLAELGDEKRRLAAIGLGAHTLSAAFGISYERLSDRAAALYRALGEWPGEDFEVPTAEAVAQGGDARPLLAELVDANLLVSEHVGRYRFRHPLIAADARDRGAESDGTRSRRAALEAMAERFLARLAFADLAVMGTRTRATDVDALTAGRDDPFGGDGKAKARALAWLKHERRTLTGLVRRGVEAGRDGLKGPDGFDGIVWRTAEMATALYMNVRFVQDWAETGRAGADAAARAGVPAAEMRLRTVVSRPLTDLGDREEARRQLERALALAPDVGDVMLESSANEFHGRLLEGSDPGAAVSAYDRAEALCATLGDDHNGRRGGALAVYFRGCAHAAAGREERARADMEDALARFLGLPDPDVRMAGRVQASLGRLHLGAGRVPEAVGVLTEAAESLKKLDATYYEAEAREDLARAMERMNLRSEAEGQLRRALEIYREGGSPRAREVERRLSDED
ncbi:ATP-binding protein [Nocardiopsis baichengensis]|uniref:ATP-binding protein n=1 Tax=Nocardiopsis baichengensis TaxID=280240 RepID=UPI00034980BD|nr:ATP-binding protein [Nocardiopsis baichengensis]